MKIPGYPEPTGSQIVHMFLLRPVAGGVVCYPEAVFFLLLFTFFPPPPPLGNRDMSLSDQSLWHLGEASLISPMPIAPRFQVGKIRC